MRAKLFLPVCIMFLSSSVFCQGYAAAGDPIHVDNDRQYVDEYRLSDAYAPEASRFLDQLNEIKKAESSQATKNLINLIKTVQSDSSLPVIAREHILMATVEQIGVSGSLDALEILKTLSTEEPEAYYLVPQCRLPHPHYFYPFNEAASKAIAQIQYRDAHDAIQSGLFTSNGVRIISDEAFVEITRYDAPTRFGAALDLLAEQNDESEAVLSAWQSLLGSFDLREKPRAYTYILIGKSKQWNQPEILKLLFSAEDKVAAQDAFFAWNSMRPPGETIELLDVFKDYPNLPLNLLLSALNEQDDSTQIVELLTTLLSDEMEGTNAALALRRLFPDDYVDISAEIALDQSASPTAKRRALLLLRDASDPKANEAIRHFSQLRTDDTPELAELRSKVTEWLQ